MSTKEFLCDLRIILLAGIVLVAADENITSVTEEIDPKGNCTCGGFPSTQIDENTEPLISQSPGLLVSCNNDGEKSCKNLCVALALAAKAKGHGVLCERLMTADELMLSAFYKICDRSWTYAEMSSDTPLCCVDSRAKVCLSIEKDNSTQSSLNSSVSSDVKSDM